MHATHARKVRYSADRSRDDEVAPKVITAIVEPSMLECKAVNDPIDHLTFDARI
jgi:hypothetical protein